MVTINLTDGYFIEKAGLDYVLKREYMSKPTKKNPESKLQVKTIGYYGKNLEHAIKDYLSLVQGDSMDGVVFRSMSDYVNSINYINDLTVKQITKLVGAE
jgi:hypothetical protein